MGFYEGFFDFIHKFVVVRLGETHNGVGFNEGGEVQRGIMRKLNPNRYKHKHYIQHITRMKCLAKDRKLNGCRNHAIGETRFCAFHDYMMNYTEEMLANSIICSGCKKMVYTSDGVKTCEKCRVRGGVTRQHMRESVVLCKKDGCNNKRSDEHEYCLKHDICHLLEDVEARSMRLCGNYPRGCRTELPLNHPKNRCETCLTKDREKDRKRRQGTQEANIQVETSEAVITEKPCTVCCKTLPMEMFQGDKGDTVTKTCRTCRNDNKKQDANRDKEHRNKLARERVYYNYQKWARTRKIEFSIDKVTFENIIKMPCYYCGITQDSGFNGVDRTNSKGIYEASNCVSCCQMCNYLKSTDSIEIFIQRIEHILTHAGRVFGHLHPEIFSNHTHVSYSIYKKGALRRGIKFNLTESEFNAIIKACCYICGKPTTDIHNNGIDRFDSEIGYLFDNCRTCCHSCNFTKNDYTFDMMIDKMLSIYNYRKSC